MRTTARRLTTIAAAVAVLGTAGVAYASWAATGTGTGNGTAATATPFVVQQSGTASGLYPTGQAAVPFTVENANAYPVTLANATASNFAVDSHHSACNVSALSAVGLTLSDTLTAGATSAKQIVVKMDNTAVDACQGATFSFDIVVTGASG